MKPSLQDPAGPHLLIETSESIARVTLNRPERRNALSLDLMRELIDCFETIGGRPTSASENVSVVVLAASGSMFCSGHDLTELKARSESEYREIFDTCVHLMSTIERMPQPVIAEVQGMATAAGCQLAATCDLVVASDEAKFATPGVKIGLFCSTPMVALSRVVGRKRALEMLLTGRAIDAGLAMEWGLANRVVPRDRLREETTALAREIAQASPLVLGIGKRAFYEQIDLDERSAYDHTREVMTSNSLAEDAQEGIDAFLTKRPATWKCR